MTSLNVIFSSLIHLPIHSQFHFSFSGIKFHCVCFTFSLLIHQVVLLRAISISWLLNRAAISMDVVSHKAVYEVLWVIPGSSIAGSHGRYTFTFLRNLHDWFPQCLHEFAILPDKINVHTCFFPQHLHKNLLSFFFFFWFCPLIGMRSLRKL